MFKFIISSVIVLSIAVAARAGTLFNYNVVVGTNMTSANDVSGMSVVKNLTASGSNSYFGMNLTSGDAIDASGTVTGGALKVNMGVFHHNGSISGASVTYINGATNATDTVASTLLGQLTPQITSTSSTFAAMSSTTGTSATTTNSVLTLAYTGAATSEAIFNIQGSQLSALNGIKINLGNAATAVINVTGSGSYSVGSGFNFQGLSSSIYSALLWNFNSATSFASTNEWAGSILGPSLTVTCGQNVDGSVYCNNFNQGSGCEVHGCYFTGPTPGTAVPLPTPVVSGLVLFATLGVASRFRGLLRV